MTRSGCVGWVDKPKFKTKRSWIKLWVLPPSINIYTLWLSIWPIRRKVYGAIWPESTCKLIWVGNSPTASPSSPTSSSGTRLSEGLSSSSEIRRSNFEEHLWPWLNFLSQLKRKPFLRQIMSSSRDKHFDVILTRRRSLIQVIEFWMIPLPEREDKSG